MFGVAYKSDAAWNDTHWKVPEFDKLLPLFEDGAAVSLGVPSVEERVDRFVGA